MLSDGLPDEVWEMVSHASRLAVPADQLPPAQVTALAEARQAARVRKDWSESDDLRRQISDMGWIVQDTSDGWKLIKG